MKKIFRVFVSLIVIVFIGFLLNILDKGNQEGLMLQKNITPDINLNLEEDLIMNSKTINLKAEGLFKLIGKTTNEVEDSLGNPARIDLSAYGYDLWIYNENQDNYIQIGIENKKVVAIYAIGKNVDIGPFYIGQPISEIYETNIIDTNITLKYNDNSYRFELSEEDINTHPLIQIDDVYAQLYFDKFEGTLSSIRLMDTPTLLKIRPFELLYRGNVLDQVKDEKNEEKLDRDNEKQIFELTNIIRNRYNIQPLKWDEKIAEVAFGHSIDMYENNEFSHNSEKYGELSDRLAVGEVAIKTAGENIAANYIDAPAVVEGWLNSKGYRESLLNEDFTHIGVGVYKKYYTQNFIQSMEQ